MKKPQIMIALAIRDRAWILQEFLKCLSNLEYPHELISLYFLINNSKDNTDEILDIFDENYGNQYKKVILNIVNNASVPQDDRTAFTRTKYIYHHLVKLKNKIREESLKEKVDYLLLLESDVLFPPNLLTSLLSHQKDVISPLIPVTIKEDRYNIMTKYTDNKKKLLHFYHTPYPPFGGVFKVDMSGGIMLIKKEVLEEVSWWFHRQGEDCGFAISCEEKGFKIYCDANIHCEHRMVKTNG